jgi:dethiobiotin synthetase
MRPLVVTGTGTEVGKTIVTAAVAAVMNARGERVAVVKPAQTGLASGDESDVEAVTRLAGVNDVHEIARYPEPLAPATAARRAGIAATPVAVAAETVLGLANRDVVLVEGAGGVLVRLDDAGGTILDIAASVDADILVVAAAGLGTLNATALTCAAIGDRGLRCLGVVIGAWPAQPGVAATANLGDLPSYADAPLLGALPEGSGALSRPDFLRVAHAGLAPDLGGTWHASSQ